MNYADKVYLRTEEVARLLDVSDRTIRRMVKDGRLPSLRVGRLIRIPASAVLPESGEGAAAE